MNWGVQGMPLLNLSMTVLFRLLALSLSNPAAPPIRVEAVDMLGNVDIIHFILAEISPYHIATLSGHTRGEFLTVSFSPDGTTLASGGDYTVKLWNMAT